jgi:hypothetical protein
MVSPIQISASPNSGPTFKTRIGWPAKLLGQLANSVGQPCGFQVTARGLVGGDAKVAVAAEVPHGSTAHFDK